MRKILTPLALFAVPGALCAQADPWMVIDDFQDQTVDPWVLVTNDTTSRALLIDEFPEGSGEYAFYVESGNYGGYWGDTFAAIAVPEGYGIAPGETGTLYCQYVASGPSNSFHIGLTDLDIVMTDGVATAPSGYGTMSAYVAVTNGDFGLRNGTTTAVSDIDLANLVWYEFWLVIHNTFDAEGNSTGTYEGYIQGPTDTEPQLVTFSDGQGGTYSSAVFRRQPVVDGMAQALDTIVIATNSGDPNNPYGGDAWLVDNIAIASGDMINGGGTSTWGGYPVSSNGEYVDTGDWMGVLYIGFDSDWVYSYDLEAYMWLPEPATDAEGSWAYIYK